MENKKGKWQIEDYLLLFSILLQDAGTFGFLPINIYQIIMLLLLFVMVIKNRRTDGFFKIPKILLWLILYVVIITLINYFDYDSIKSIAYFSLHMISLYFYVRYIDDKKKILIILYIASFILSILGLIQYFGYITNIRWLYDISLYGFRSTNIVMGNGMVRLHSIYSEPAHLSALLSCSLYIGLTQKDKTIKKSRTILIVLFSLITRSVLVYFSMAVFVLLYIFQNKKKTIKKEKSNKKVIFVAIIGLLGIILSFYTGNLNFMLEKVYTLYHPQANNTSHLTGFAIVSNIKISLAKLEDWNIIGTGMDSHRLSYYKYINQLYKTNIRYKLNVDDAASLFTRVFSEFGLIGIIVMLVFVLKKLLYYFKNNNKEMIFFMILFILSALRSGNYTIILTSLSFMVILIDTEKKIIKVEKEQE